VFGNALSLGLLIGSGLSSGLGLCFCGLAFLLTLYLGVFSSIPRIEDLAQARY
jgi:hypothetical protein